MQTYRCLFSNGPALEIYAFDKAEALVEAQKWASIHDVTVVSIEPAIPELSEEENMKIFEMTRFKQIIIIILLVLIGITSCFLLFPLWNVWQAGLSGEAVLKRAEQTRKIQIEQARGEKEAAALRAEAIRIVGQAAKDFPEYRKQEFIGAFAEALHSGKINQIIYVPTESNIPIIEASRTRTANDVGKQ